MRKDIQIAVRMPTDLKERLEARAGDQGLSLASYVRKWLEVAADFNPPMAGVDAALAVEIVMTDHQAMLEAWREAGGYAFQYVSALQMAPDGGVLKGESLFESRRRYWLARFEADKDMMGDESLTGDEADALFEADKRKRGK